MAPTSVRKAGRPPRPVDTSTGTSSSRTAFASPLRKGKSPVASGTRSARKKKVGSQLTSSTPIPMQKTTPKRNTPRKTKAAKNTAVGADSSSSSTKSPSLPSPSTPQPPPSTNKKKRKQSKTKSKDATTDNTSSLALTPFKTLPDKITKRSPSSLDVSVHRMRFFGYQPKPIVCLMATPPHENASDYVALARGNGTVELKSPDEKWRTVATVSGMSTRPMNVMAWTCGGTSAGHDGNDNGPVDMNPTTTQSSQSPNNSTYASSYHKSHTRVHNRRTLIGASSDGTIFIVDFSKGCQTAVTGSGGGAVLALVSLCGTCQSNHSSCCSGSNESSSSSCCQLVAAGCEDGSVRIYRVVLPQQQQDQQQPKLELVSTIACSVGSAILSLAWRRLGNNNNNHGMIGTVLYAGVADGTIRRYDCVSSSQQVIAATATASGHAMSTNAVLATNGDSNNASWKSTLRMTVECLGRNTPTRVWALQTLEDGTVVSGDSLGHVQFWDGNTGTLVQSFDQNDNQADVLGVVVAKDECSIFCSGVDSRVVCLERPRPCETTTTTTLSVSTTSTAATGGRWIMTHAQRPHTHDVKALALCRVRDPLGTLHATTQQQEKEVLCTGGVDTKLCTYMVKDFRRVRPKIMYPWPEATPITVAKKARILAFQREHRIDLYQLGPAPQRDAAADATVPVLLSEENTLVGTLEIKGGHNFTCSALSEDGRLLAVSDAAGTLLFQWTYEQQSDGSTTAVPQKVELPTHIMRGLSCGALKFTSSSRLVCATTDGSIHVLGIKSQKTDWKVTLEHTFTDTSHNNHGAGSMRAFPIHSLHVSNDGKWLAAVRNGLSSGSTQIFSLPSTSSNNKDGSYKHWWDIPALEAPHTAVTFLGDGDSSSPQQLAISCTNFAFYVFDIQEKRLSTWSERAGFPVTPKLPAELTSRNDVPVRLASHPSSPRKFLMGSAGAFCAVNLDRSLPKHCQSFPETHVRGKRRKLRQITKTDNNNSQGHFENEETSGEDLNHNCTICLRYNSMLYLDFLEKNEMLVVEQPWLSVVASFPDALDRKVYGS